MPQYIIHIGPPKTGTKYLQSALNRLRPELEKDGIAYPDDLWTARHHFSHEQLVQLLRQNKANSLAPMFNRLNGSDYKTVLLSCEGFTALDRDQLSDLKGLIGDNPVNFVYYCRRWSDWIPSAWQEMIRQGSQLSLPQLLNRYMNAPTFEQEINFGIILELFCRAFGESSLVLKSYSNLKDRDEDLLSDFLNNVLNVSYDLSGFANSRPNASSSIEDTELLRILNIREFSASGGVRIRFKEFVEKIPEDSDLSHDRKIVQDSINSHLTTMILNDDAPWLRPVYLNIVEKYASRFFDRDSDDKLKIPFRRQTQHVQYGNEAYLLDQGVVSAIERIHLAARSAMLP